MALGPVDMAIVRNGYVLGEEAQVLSLLALLFTCFNRAQRVRPGRGGTGAQFTCFTVSLLCFTGTKVQMLTPEAGSDRVVGGATFCPRLHHLSQVSHP